MNHMADRLKDLVRMCASLKSKFIEWNPPGEKEKENPKKTEHV